MIFTRISGGMGNQMFVYAAARALSLRWKRDEIVENLPHEEYVRTMSACDIYIDQVHSHGPGVGALENMAMGKIVLTGNSPDCQQWMPFSVQSPAIHAPDDPAQLALAAEDLLNRKGDYAALAEAGRSYVSRFHGHEVVARQFIKLWEGRL